MAAPNLVGQLFEKKRRHGSAQPDMHRTDFAFGKGDNLRAGKANAFEDAGQVFLVARNPVQTFGQQDAGLAAVDRGDRGGQPWPIANSAADCWVSFFADDAPAFALGAFAQQAQLVFDRILRLHSGRIAGVENGIGHLRGAESLVLSAIMALTRSLAKFRANSTVSAWAGARPLSRQSIRAKAPRSVTCVS
uniref:hypothetical protein n=1 Tax=Erythrobacter sp. EC-HK427 TaxID=2038396 RepID=UPI001F39FE47|nr:hypothetical protein [Erythrobacter sp. EC-HK427]